MVLDTMRSMKVQVGEHTALYGLVTGPFTLASHLRGTEIFMDMFDRKEYLVDLISFCTSVAMRMADYYREAGTDCIAVDENIDLAKAKQITDRYNITIEGNIPLTTRMLFGTQQDNMKYVLDLVDSLMPQGKVPKNLIISPGCDMPYDIPVENVIGAMQAIRDPETARLMVASYQAEALDLESVIIPNYKSRSQPLMEVFPLDSATCPACGYMMNAAMRACEELAGQVDMVEYKITQPENVARLVKMGIKNLPSILINGDLKFSSLIPSNRELIDEIKK